MIESLQNTKVKNWMKLKRKKDRMKTKSFLVEGEHLVEEAIKSDWKVKNIIIQEGYDASFLSDINTPIFIVTQKVFLALSSTEHPQGIMAEMEMKEDVYQSEYRRILLLDSIQDPGNVGTIIRTADAFRFDAIVLGDGTVDIFNEKVIRASQGSIFHLPLFHGNLIQWIKKLKEDQCTIWATALSNATSLPELEMPNKVAVVLGNEGNGVQEELLEASDYRVFIPITGQAESLNVSIASSIIMYELRQ